MKFILHLNLCFFQVLYESKKISFIMEEDDTVYEYEQRGRRQQGENSSYERGMMAFGSIDRINQVEVLTGKLIILIIISIITTSLICYMVIFSRYPCIPKRRRRGPKRWPNRLSTQNICCLIEFCPRLQFK